MNGLTNSETLPCKDVTISGKNKILKRGINLNATTGVKEYVIVFEREDGTVSFVSLGLI